MRASVFMTHAADCHDDLVAALETMVMIVEDARTGSIPAKDWHGFRRARAALDRAKSLRAVDLLDD